MLRKYSLIGLAIASLAQSAQAQTISDQIASVRSVQDAEQNRIAAEQQYRTEQAARQESAQRAAAAAVERKREAARASLRAEALADKERNQHYEDQLREQILQERNLELKREEARVARENDYIDRELHRQDARTDVIQSEADVNRNLSEGSRDLLRGLGNAAVASALAPTKPDAQTDANVQTVR